MQITRTLNEKNTNCKLCRARNLRVAILWRWCWSSVRHAVYCCLGFGHCLLNYTHQNHEIRISPLRNWQKGLKRGQSGFVRKVSRLQKVGYSEKITPVLAIDAELVVVS